MRRAPHTATRVRRWAAGIGTAAGAGLAAAVIGTAAASAARADDGSAADPITLLETASTDMNEALGALNAMPGTITIEVGEEPTEMFDRFKAIQSPLFSSDNSFLSGAAGVLFDGPDQQLEQASENFLTAAQALAADPSSSSAEAAMLSADLQYLEASLVDSLFPNVVGEVVDQLFGIGDVDSTAGGVAELASAAADLG